MIKICSPQLGLSPDSHLGGEVYDYFTIKGFGQMGIKVFTYLPKNKYFDNSLKNVKNEYSTFKHIVPPWLFSFISLPFMVRTYKRQKFDILRIHSPRFLGLAGVIFNRMYPNVPILSSGVTVDDSVFFYWIEKWIFTLSKKIIVQSSYMKNRLIRRFNLPEEKIFITYGGQLGNVTKWKKIPKEASILTNKNKIILFMGSLISRKNPLLVVKVFVELKKQDSLLKLVIIGKGSLKKKIVLYLKKNKLLDEVIFINSAFGNDKSYWFSRMDVLLVPSVDEGFGLVATEAMSFKKPVVCSDRAAFKEIISNSIDGYTLPLNNQKAWMNVVGKILRDPKLSKRIGINAYRTVKSKFNWKKSYILNYQVVKDMINP